MKEIRKKIREALWRHPEAFNSRQVLKNILNDAFSDKPLQNNLLMTAYDANIGSALRDNEVLDMPLYNRWTKKLADNFGLTEHRAGWAIINWFLIYNKKVLPEVTDTWNGSNESPETSKPIKTETPNPKLKKSPSGNEEKKHLLETVYRANFPNTPKWIFFKSNYDESNIFRKNEITRDMKEIALKLVCHERYRENEIIHLRISSELSHGWALTHDSFCIGGTISNFIIKYVNFDSMKFGNLQNLIPVKDMELKIGSPYDNNFSYSRETIFLNGESNSDIIIRETSGRENSIPYVSQYSESSIIAEVFTPLNNFLKAAKNICAGGNLSAKNNPPKTLSNNADFVDIGFIDNNFWY